eukprot:5972531-Amphidinium_carterae.2
MFNLRMNAGTDTGKHSEGSIFKRSIDTMFINHQYVTVRFEAAPPTVQVGGKQPNFLQPHKVQVSSGSQAREVEKHFGKALRAAQRHYGTCEKFLLTFPTRGALLGTIGKGNGSTLQLSYACVLDEGCLNGCGTFAKVCAPFAKDKALVSYVAAKLFT